MGQLAIPIAIGAAVGGGSKLLQGKGFGDILKGAALGGAGGAATGGLGSLLGSAGTAATSGATSGASQGAAGLLGSTAGNVASLAPTAANLATTLGESVLANSGQFANLGASPITDTLASSAINTLPVSAMDTLNGAAGLQNATSLIPTRDLANSAIGMAPMSLWENMKNLADKYGTVQNLTGAANVGMQYANSNQPKPMQAGGQIQRGQAPTMDALLALQQAGYGLPQRKKLNLSLIG